MAYPAGRTPNWQAVETRSATNLGALGIYVTEVAWWLVRPLVFMIWGGVFERHPKLKASVTEGSSIWTPELLALMDHRYQAHHFTAKLATPERSWFRGESEDA